MPCCYLVVLIFKLKKMRCHPRPSRRLTLMVVFLLYAISCKDTLTHLTSSAANLVWIQVPPQHQQQAERGYGGTSQCLNWFGENSECSSVNLWYLKTDSKSGKELLVVSAEFPDLCLGRTPRAGGIVEIVPCNSPWWGLHRNRWTLDELTNHLSVPRTKKDLRLLGTLHSGPAVVSLASTAGEGGTIYTVVPMIPQHKVLYVEDDTTASTASIVRDRGAEVGASGAPQKKSTTWVCPKTNLRFPTELGRYFTSQFPLVLMGSDVYTKHVFGFDWKVYTVALYVSQQFRDDKDMNIYRSFGPTELSSDSRFFEQIVSETKILGRALIIKLALDLKCSMLIEGLLTELMMEPQNKDILYRNIESFSDYQCPRGLEILFNWKEEGSLEVSFLRPGQPVIRTPLITSKAVGNDFFKQFLTNNEPVAPGLLVAVGQAWPSFALGDIATVSPQQQPESSLMSKLEKKIMSIESRIPSAYLAVLSKIRLSWRPFSHTGRTPNNQRWKIRMHASLANDRGPFTKFFDKLIEMAVLVLLLLLVLPPTSSLIPSSSRSSSGSSSSGSGSSGSGSGSSTA